MSHEVESMFYTGEVPWHGLGTHVEDAPDAETAIREAGLDWEVECRPVFTDGAPTASGRTPRLLVRDVQAVVRTSDGRVLSGVGSRYVPVQNREAFAFCDAIGSGPDGSGDVRYETAGSLKEGRVVWMLARMERDRFEVVPGDAVVPYLLLSNRHDGRGSLFAKVVNTRVVCQNTLTAAVGEAGNTFRVRHLGDVSGKVDAARDVLGLARQLVFQETEIARQLASRLVSVAFVRDLFEKLLPLAEDAGPRTVLRIGRERGELVRLFEEAPGNDLPGVAGTAWAAVNAATYVATHGVRKGRGDAAERLFESALFGAGEDLGRRAVELALAA